MLQEKKVVLGVSGSIAAYKAIYLMRLCMEAGAEVRAALTQSAARFVGPLSFSAISGHAAITDMWSEAMAGRIGHVEAAHEADVLVLAPATADLLARLATGRANCPLTALALATRAPWVVAPAMETGMWENPATQANVATLQQRGAIVVAPGEGHLASGRAGAGRMAEPEHILETIVEAITQRDMTTERVLVTAGPTREAFDPVRFLSNRSSGKMGYALARVARRRGASVKLVSGPTTLAPPSGVRLTRVATTEQMLQACQQEIDDATVLLMAAAPSDFRPACFSPAKVKKGEGSGAMTVELSHTPDILTALKNREKGKIVVGFAAESGHLVRHARDKLVKKDLDMIVANDVTHPEAGFAVDTNAVVIIRRDGSETPLPVMSKEAVAMAILDHVRDLRRAKKNPGSAPTS